MNVQLTTEQADKELNRAIQATIAATNQVIGKQKIENQGRSEPRSVRLMEELNNPSYLVGLFVTALRRESWALYEKLQGSPAVKTLEDLWSTGSWRGVGQPSSFTIMTRCLPSGEAWHLPYSKVSQMCLGVFVPENLERIALSPPIFQQVSLADEPGENQDIIDGIQGLNSMLHEMGQIITGVGPASTALEKVDIRYNQMIKESA